MNFSHFYLHYTVTFPTPLFPETPPTFVSFWMHDSLSLIRHACVSMKNGGKTIETVGWRGVLQKMSPGHDKAIALIHHSNCE